MKHFDLNNTEEKELVPGFFAKLVHSDNITIAYWRVVEGAEVSDHSHPHEQFVTVIEGEFELTVDGKPMIMKAGEVIYIPSNVPHRGRAITDCLLIDTFNPAREDLKN